MTARGVFWSEGGSLVAIASDASFYLLEYQRDLAESVLASGQVRAVCRPLPALSHSTLPAGLGAWPEARLHLPPFLAPLLTASKVAAGPHFACAHGRGRLLARRSKKSFLAGPAVLLSQEVDEDGIEDAFELTSEIPEKIRTGIWVRLRQRCRAGRAPACGAPSAADESQHCEALRQGGWPVSGIAIWANACAQPAPLRGAEPSGHCACAHADVMRVPSLPRPPRWATASSTTTLRGASTTAWAAR